MPLPNFPTPHCHIQSLDSASTPQAFIAREKALGTGCVTCTDHGSMAACRTVYDLAKKEGLTPILGVEAYFRDDNCPILLKAGITNVKDYAKYFHITLHALDQTAYEALAKVLSRASLNRMEKHGAENKPLFDWNDLRELANFNITFTTGCLIGMVQRHYLLGRPELGQAYLSELQSFIPKGNLYVEIFPHKTDKNWVSGVFIKLQDGTQRRYYADKTLRINGEEITAEKAAAKYAGKTATLEAVKNYRAWTNEPTPIVIMEIKHVEEFMDNECIPGALDCDSQKWTNLAMLELATKGNLPALVSDDAHFATPDEKVVQDVRLMAGGGAWRFYASYHRVSSEEAERYFFDTYKDIGKFEPDFLMAQLVKNNQEWAARFKNFKFDYNIALPTKFYPEDTLLHIKKLIDRTGRMNWKDAKYVERLKAEIEMLYNNGTVDLLPYFFIDQEVCELYEKNGLLTGPGRGSAAGLLLSYLVGITHVDPLKFSLSLERFLTLDRIKNGKMPDIDQDLPHRDLLVNPADPKKGWLAERFGDHVAQISTDTKLKLRSSVKDVARVTFGKVPREIDKLAGAMEVAPQGVEDKDFIFGYEGPGGWVDGSIQRDEALNEYVKAYPDQWEIVQKLLGLTRQKSRHACAYVIMNEPVANRIPLTQIGGYTVTAYTMKSVEASGGLKMDFLVVNVLNDISECIKMIQYRRSCAGNECRINGPHCSAHQFGHWDGSETVIDGKRVPLIRVVPFNGKLHDIWDLPQDKDVYNDICSGITETVFQLNTSTARQFLRQFNVNVGLGGWKALRSIEDLAAFTALDRPGPLDAYVESPDGRKHNMLVEFANRAKGKGAIDAIPILDELLPETYGVIVYQEQLQRIFQTIGKTTAIEADTFRIHIGKKEMNKVTEDREVFMRGAVETVGKAVAEKIWAQMYTFGQYGFNKSHAVCYVVISYACAWLKHHYPLEWWTAVLRNATRKEIDEKFWRHCGHLVNLPDIKRSGAVFDIVKERIQAPLSLLHGVGEAAHQWLVEAHGRNTIRDLLAFEREKRMSMGKWVLDKKGKERFKLGHSPLNRGVLYKLFLGGAADSLFSEGTTALQKLTEYEETYAEINEKKSPRPIDPKYADLTPLQRFQLKKKILPAYTEDLHPLLLDAKIEGVEKMENGVYYREGNDLYRFVNAEQFERLDNLEMLPTSISVAVAAYVVADRRFKYKGNNQASELTLDHSGNRIAAVKWPNKDTGKLPKYMADDYTGSIAIVLLTKYNEKKPFVIDAIRLVSGQLEEQPEEESP